VKVGRNELCPCGSGKKYKKCCLHKEEGQRLAEAIMAADEVANQKGRVDCCLYPLKSECDGKIVKAHAIQNNRILRKISDNGRVVTTNGVSNLLFQDTKLNGRSNATTFHGFCKYHDKTVFQDIEDKPFAQTSKQLFLLAYRTFAWHYHKKMEQQNKSMLFESVMKSKGFRGESDINALFKKGMMLGLRDNEKKKAVFDSAILSEEYGILDSCTWTLPYEIQFAASMMYEMMYDICGVKINAHCGDSYTKSIYLNIFPMDGQTYCVWSWFKEDHEYRRFAEQFMALDYEDKKNYLNNKLPAWTDSLVISPSMWNTWGHEVQEAFIAHANMGDLYTAFELEDNGRPFEYASTPWDLFACYNQDNS